MNQRTNQQMGLHRAESLGQNHKRETSDACERSDTVGRASSSQAPASMTSSTQTSHEAVADLCELLGSPTMKTAGGVKVFTWRGSKANDPDSILSPDGDGILICRCPRIDRSSPERVWNEFGVLLALIQRQGLRPSTLLVTFGSSGNQSYSERRHTDVGEIEAGIAAGRYKWVAYSDFERISRSTETFEQILRLLEGSDTDLYLGHSGCKVDWTRDALLLQACGAVVGGGSRRRRR